MQSPTQKQIGIIFGPNGVGKGTLAHHLADTNSFIHLNSGNLIRHWVEKQHNNELQTALDDGEMMDDQIVEDVWIKKFETLAVSNLQTNLVIEGMPRRHSQVAILQSLCKKYSYTIAWIIVLHAPLEEILSRVEQRVLAPDGNVYHMVLNPPPKEFAADQLVKRLDDRPHVVKKRYENYLETTMECLSDSFFKDIPVQTIDATKSIPEVFEEAEVFVNSL